MRILDHETKNRLAWKKNQLEILEMKNMIARVWKLNR